MNKISDYVKVAMSFSGITFPKDCDTDEKVINYLNDNFKVESDEYQTFVEYYLK